MSSEHYRSSEFNASAENGCGLIAIAGAVLTALILILLYLFTGWVGVFAYFLIAAFVTMGMLLAFRVKQG